MHIHLNFVNTDAVSAARAENLLPNVRQMHSDSGECRLPVPRVLVSSVFLSTDSVGFFHNEVV